jgi:hypothetical protein
LLYSNYLVAKQNLHYYCCSLDIWLDIGIIEGKRPLGRPRRRWEDNIKLDLRETGIDGANWIPLAQDRVHWRAFVNTVMNLRVP